jgi:methionyl-tRNA synthetase
MNKLGNLVSRVSALAEKYGIERPEVDLDYSTLLESVEKNMETFQFDKALNEIFTFIDAQNEYISEKKPWETKDKKVLYELANAIKKISILLYPFIPETCEKISKNFGSYKFTIKELKKDLDENTKIKKGEHLFSRVE